MCPCIHLCLRSVRLRPFSIICQRTPISLSAPGLPFTLALALAREVSRFVFVFTPVACLVMCSIRTTASITESRCSFCTLTMRFHSRPTLRCSGSNVPLIVSHAIDSVNVHGIITDCIMCLSLFSTPAYQSPHNAWVPELGRTPLSCVQAGSWRKGCACHTRRLILTRRSRSTLLYAVNFKSL